MNPFNQFIAIAPDCTLKEALIPQARGNKHTIAAIQYGLLSNKPYGYTLEELKFATHVLHKHIADEALKAQRKARNIWVLSRTQTSGNFLRCAASAISRVST